MPIQTFTDIFWQSPQTRQMNQQYKLRRKEIYNERIKARADLALAQLGVPTVAQEFSGQLMPPAEETWLEKAADFMEEAAPVVAVGGLLAWVATR